MNCPESGNGIPFLNYVKSKRHSIAVQTRHTKGKVLWGRNLLVLVVGIYVQLPVDL